MGGNKTVSYRAEDGDWEIKESLERLSVLVNHNYRPVEIKGDKISDSKIHAYTDVSPFYSNLPDKHELSHTSPENNTEDMALFHLTKNVIAISEPVSVKTSIDYMGGKKTVFYRVEDSDWEIKENLEILSVLVNHNYRPVEIKGDKISDSKIHAYIDVSLFYSNLPDKHELSNTSPENNTEDMALFPLTKDVIAIS